MPDYSSRKASAFPVLDIFAGPGGLGEGFSSVNRSGNAPGFELKLSIEKDATAARTLFLRALFRLFAGKPPAEYYQYVRGQITRDEFLAAASVQPKIAGAMQEARQAELGKTPHEEIDRWISQRLGESTDWVLIGGPPCQAYSLAGRGRRSRETSEQFEGDERHLLYREYLRILAKFQPAVFVMENVKGILSSKLKGERIFERILADLRNPADGPAYHIRSLVVAAEPADLVPTDFIIRSEDYGIPQSRHRVILLGIRDDVYNDLDGAELASKAFVLRPAKQQVPLHSVISDLPRIRSALSREHDSPDRWASAVGDSARRLAGWSDADRIVIQAAMRSAATKAGRRQSPGAPYIEKASVAKRMPRELRRWLIDRRLKGSIQHESRSHMRSDLARYLFAAAFAKVKGRSPRISDFPTKLMPAHQNCATSSSIGSPVPFADRFRVQLAHEPSTTIVSHIAKDGHYYVHPDPSQCRSLTVREAARLQTFPDNYFFEGNRTQQYAQVGNAVPPLLARQIARIVLRILVRSRAARPRR